MTTRLPFTAYLEHLRRDSARFVDVLARTDPEAPVPSCPEWTAADLLHHLTEVQWFWATVVSHRLTAGEQVEALEGPQRAQSYPAMIETMRAASATLVTALAAAPPQTPTWTWAPEQTAGFVCRRQAHEALIHRVDAELAGLAHTALDPALAADGVDEVLRVMYGGCPPWGTITPKANGLVRIRAADTGSSWVVTSARFTGTDPKGTVHDEAGVHVANDDGRPVHATIEGTAAALDCWLWHRPTDEQPAMDGDPDLLGRLQEVLNQPVN